MEKYSELQQDILADFKRYDGLNSNTSLIKILVSYIKPSFLFKSEILTPIHLGRAIEKENSKDGIISDDDLKWLHENCIGDDDFEGNISDVNRRVGFLTGTYWAWKNYEKLGNPKYFGSFGYRRFLNPNFLDNLEKYDLILPRKKDFKLETLKEQFSGYHGDKLYMNMMNVFNNIYHQEIAELEKYFNGTSGYFDELYVMKKEIFFDFCEWIFPLLFEYLKMTQITLKNNDFRDVGFMIERLTGYYCNKLTKQVKTLEKDVIVTEKMIVNKQKLTKNLLAKLRNTMK